MSAPGQRYVPAAGRAALTGLYDPVLALTMRERHWRPALIEAVTSALPADGTAVDIGAGTGTFAIALADSRPDVNVIAIDGDSEVLALARSKPGSERVQWLQALAAEVPLAEASADVAVMSLLLHHLDLGAKDAALRDAARVLRPRGRIFIADWGRPRGLVPRIGFTAVQLLDGREGTRDHAAGRLPELIRAAGFLDVQLSKRLATAFGTLEILSARAVA